MLPKQYAWLANEPGPRLLVEGLKTFGVAETPGAGNTPEIMRWAKSTGLDRVYRNDSDAWCGLWMTYVAMQAGWDVKFVNPLGARNWLQFGRPVAVPELGNVLVFWRERRDGWKGHVCEYVGEDATHFHVMGGNQGDRVSIKRMARDRLLGARECPWRVSKPGNIRRVFLAASGAVSTNEA